MNFRRFTTYLLVTNFTFQTCLPIYAMQDIQDVANNSSILKHGAVPARLDFKVNPEQTAAGPLFYARRKNVDGDGDVDVVEVLLGLRDDEDSYCNPGGKSDKEDGTLDFTGAREGGEETFNIFCPHSEILRAQPFVDLYSLKADKKSQDKTALKPFLNRMYFVEQEHVDEKHFNDRLKNAASLKLSHHQQEYRSFTWVLAEDLLKAAQNKTPKFTASNSQLEITLFDPLFQTLLTDTAQGLLQHLVTHKKIPQFSSRKKPLVKNQLHIEGVSTIQKSPRISWPFPDDVNYEELAKEAKRNAEISLEVQDIALSNLKTKKTAEQPVKRIYRKEDVEKIGKDNLANEVFPPLKHETIGFDKDAFGRGAQERTVQLEKLPLVQKEVQDPLKNRILFGRAVAAKAAASLEIKERSGEATDIEKQRKQLANLKHLDEEYFENNQTLIKASEEKSKGYFYKTPKLIEAEKGKVSTQLQHILEQDLEEPQKAQLDMFEITILNEDVPTLSDLLLQVQLDVDYVKPKNPKDPESRRQADILNLKKYHAKYGSVEGELKRDVAPLDTDFERISDILEIERQYKNWVPLHHASKPEVKYFWVANTRLRELLAVKPVEKGTNPGMRATDIYFRGYSNMKESVEKAGTGDYEMGNANRRLSANMAATAGLRTTYTSSSSVEYFFNAHSVLMPATLKRFEESTQLLGMVDTSYLPYQSLYEQYFGLVSKDTSNSAWTILLLNPEILDTYSYPAHGGGKFFNPDFPTKEEGSIKGMQSSIAGYERARRDLLDKIQVKEMSVSAVESNSTQAIPGRLVESIGEIRFLLHPLVMFSSNNSKTFSVDRFPLSGAKNKKLQWLLTAINVNDIGRWLGSHSQIMPDSLQEMPAIKKLYARAHQGLTGEPVVETVSADAFPHLVKNGHFDGAKQFFDSYQESIEEMNLSPKALTLSAIESGNRDLLEFILKDVAKKAIADLFVQEDIIALMMSCLLKNQFLETHAYVLQNYDMGKISNEVKRQWACDVMIGKSAEAIDFFHDHIFPITEDILDDVIGRMIKTGIHEGALGMAKSKVFSKLKIADKLIGYFTSDHLTAQPNIEFLLKRLLREGLDLKECLPTSGNPLLFYFPYFNTAFSDDISNEKQRLEAIQKDPLLFDCKNKEGLNILQFIQQSFLKGRGNVNYLFWNDTLKKNMTDHKREFVKESYLPYLEEFGEMEYSPEALPFFIQKSPFSDATFCEWHKQLQGAMNSGTLAQVVEVFRQAPKEDLLYQYVHKNPRNYMDSKKRYQGASVVKSWVNLVCEALKMGENAWYERLKEEMPVKFFTSEFDHRLNPLTQDFPTEAREIESMIKAYMQKVQQSKNEWNQILTGLLVEGKYKELFFVIDAALDDVGNSIEDAVFATHIPYMYDLQQQCKKNMLSSSDIYQLISKPVEFLQALSDGKMTQSAVKEQSYTIFKDGNLALVTEILKKLYLDPLDLVTKKDFSGHSDLENIVRYGPIQEGVFRAFLTHGGCFNMLKHLDLNIYQQFLNVASADLLNFIEGEAPEVFSHSDEFLEISLDLKRFQTFEFIQNNLSRIKSIYDKTSGIPIIFYTFMDNPELFQRIVEVDPTILDLKTRQGLDVEHLLEHLLGSDNDNYQQFKRLIELHRKK